MIISEFTDGMRRIVYPVCIASAASNKINTAITVSSVTSVSINPPTLLVCINSLSSMSNSIKKDEFVNISFLNFLQHELASICSNKDQVEKRFDSDDWLYDKNQTPYVKDSEMVAFCIVNNVTEFATHQVAFLSVQSVKCSQNIQPQPLLYQNGKYCKI